MLILKYLQKFNSLWIDIYEYNINDATAITIFFRRQAEKSPVFLEEYLQKLTFCRIAINFNK